MKSKEPQPPGWAARFLRWFCSDRVLEFLQGDLYELYYNRLEKLGRARANFHLFFDVLSAIRPFAFKKFRSKSNFTIMLRHNLILTFRNFKKFKSQFLINLTGLTTGFASVLFIYLWVADELQTDRFHEKSERLYQVMSNHTDASGVFTWKGVPGLLLEEIQAKVPEVEAAAASTDTHEFTVSFNQTYYKAQGKFASQDYFEVFSYPFLAGNPEKALSGHSGIVLTESLAQRIFKSTDVIGKPITWHFRGAEKSFQVTGVIKDLPPTASDQFEYLMPWKYYHNELIDYKNWYNYYGRIMLTLREDADKAAAEAKIDAILKEKQEGGNVDLFLTSYTDRYLHGKYENGKQAGGRIEYVRLFSIIAAFILFIASINFINLSTAKAAHRMKEIGIKKTLGASRQSLISQFFTESILLSITALVLSLLLVWILLPQFNFITQKDLALELSVRLLLVVLALVMAVGIIAGSYPVLYLSGFKSIEVLKGRLTTRFGEIFGRRMLVVTQFTLSMILIVSVIVVYKQMDFIRNKNLGYSRDNLIYFDREGKLMENYQAFIGALKAIPEVDNAAVSGFNIGGANSTGGVDWDGKTPEDQIQFWEIKAGEELIELLGIEVLQGRSFSEEHKSDAQGIIFNEAAIAAMGMENPIGKKVRHYKGERTIIGVVKDFNLVSLHTKVEPALFLYEPGETPSILVRIKNGNESQTLEKIETLYRSFNPGYVFNPTFLDQDYQALYASEQRVSTLSQYFAGFAIFISCLGLFGLAAFTTERRIKEIGIRKVLGSTVFGIINLLTLEYTKMILIAIVLAIPVSYYLASQWLNDFAYRISLDWWIFAVSAVAALLVAWLTVGIQTFRAATTNPTKCLRNE